MLKAIWRDDTGFLVSSELLLIVTILVLGLLVGIAAVRNSVVTEFTDLAAGIGALDQSYSFRGVTSCGGYSCGSIITDAPDHCEISDGANGADDASILEPPGGGGQ